MMMKNNMSIIATRKEFTPDLIDEGSYPATIYSMIEVGTQVNPMFNTESQKVRITYELPTELKVFNEEKGEQPRVISQEYTLSIHEKAKLRPVVEACIPEALKVGEDGFVDELDIEKLIGKNCLVTIKHKDSAKGVKYQNVDSVTIMPKGMKSYKQINETKVLSFKNWNEEMFSTLPDFIKEKITNSPEYKDMKGITRNEMLDKTEDIPFGDESAEDIIHG